MMYGRGDIVWVKFPFSDSSTSKLRPALIISNSQVNRSGDYLLMQITSKLRGDQLSLQIDNHEYTGAPLLMPGELRLHKIFILHNSLVAGKITSVSNEFMKTVIAGLLKLIQ